VWGPLFVSCALVAVGAGCGSSDTQPGGDGGADVTGGTTTSGSTTGSGGAGGGSTTSSTNAGGNGGASTSSTTNTGGSGGGSGDGDDTFETATELTLGDDAIAADLADVVTDVDFYKFTGKKGDAIVIVTSAKPDADKFDPTYPDTVITLYDDAKDQIAENDDPTPRFSNDAILYTILPKDGTYYFRVAECNAAFGETNCAPAEDIDTTDYVVAALLIDNAAKSTAFEGPDADNNAIGAKNPVINYEKASSGYYLTTIYGQFDSLTDVDVFSVKLPADTKVEPGSGSTGSFYVFPSGPEQDGSDSPVGKMWIANPDGSVVARIDASKDDKGRELSPPLALDTPYFLFVERPAGGTLNNDFYFLNHSSGGSNPLEIQDPTNDDVTTPEVLKVAAQTTSYFVDGTLATPTDTDHFSVAIPSGLTEKKISIACGAERLGSGVTGLKAELLNPADANAVVASATESATKNLLIDAVALPQGASKLLVKVTGAAQTADVSSSFYRCGIHLQ
jgi:hypothetical protein